MCGIFIVKQDNGFNLNDYIVNNKKIDSKEYICLLLKNANLLNHRGENDNYIINKNILLYHNRLAINDLSVEGNQPLIYKNINLVINGEIYNYEELYEEVKKDLPDYIFKSHSDSEILIPLYLLYGTSFIYKLKGMFSFVLYDSEKNVFLAARDPIGITSLYYAKDKNRIIISSELKSLINLSSNVYVFTPGTFLINNVFYNYYRPLWLIDKNLPNNKLVYSELRSNLINSVYSHIKLTDQPLGFLLSGGLDSSLIVSIATYLKNVGKINNEIYTYTIGLVGGNDLKYAEETAKYLKTKHTTYNFTFNEVINNLKSIIYYIETYDITTVRASICNYLLINKIKKNTNIKVLLSGEGSDELFGGYLYFHKCPSEKEMHLELVDKMVSLHKYDCLRSHKSGMSNTIEVRVPFLDIDFVNYIMSIDPRYKMINDDQPIEKYILRKAFDSNIFLPNNILYRQKEQFSDGISNKENNLIDQIKEYANISISDEMYNNKNILFPINTPINKEHMLYRTIFEEVFNNNESIIKTVDYNNESIACSTKRGLSWLNVNNNSNLNDPSGRSIIDIYNN